MFIMSFFKILVGMQWLHAILTALSVAQSTKHDVR
jgi:hypothetical protein